MFTFFNVKADLVAVVCSPGFPMSTLSVLLVTYCGVQLVKERERKLALLEEPEPSKAKTD